MKVKPAKGKPKHAKEPQANAKQPKKKKKTSQKEDEVIGCSTTTTVTWRVTV